MVSKKIFDWKKHLTKCLQSTEYCALATVDEEGVWSNTVYFAWDEYFSLYFISQMHSRHMQNIRRNPSVAVSVYKTEQKGDVFGIQLEGNASILLDDKKEIKNAFRIYHGRTGGGKDVEQYINNPTWIFVKIVPGHLYYFDTRFFGEERQEVPLEKPEALLK